MNFHSLKIDDKSRLTLPKDSGILPGDSVYGSIYNAYLILSKTSLSGIGIIRGEVDGGRKLLVNNATISGMGFDSRNTPSYNEVLWVPRMINANLDFLLFFGEKGKGVWESMRTVKENIHKIDTLTYKQ